MALKIVKGSLRVSGGEWYGVDQAVLFTRLQTGLSKAEAGARNALREIYAGLLSDDLANITADDCKLPHHVIDDDGNVVLNKDGLSDAMRDLASGYFPESKTRAAAEHLARHYRETGDDLPDELVEILGSNGDSTQTDKKSMQVFTLDAGGRPIDLAGSSIVPRSGSVMGLVCYSRPGPGSYGADGIGTESLAARKDKWPEGRSDDALFLNVTYRALSAGLVNPDSWPIDFSKAGVLKKATKFLIGRPFLKDHRKNVEAQIGSVQDTIWDEGEETMPAGINALVRINLSAPQSATVAPLIEAKDANSVSVTVWYEWEKSHPDLDDWQFFDMWGEEIDGEIVRPIATKILDLSELSQVWDGADPNAKRIEASASDDKPYYISCAVGVPPSADGKDLAKQFAQPDGGRSEADYKESRMLDKVKKALAKLFGVATDEITEEFAADVIAGSRSLEETEGVKTLLAAKLKKVDEYLGRIEERDTEIKSLKAAAVLLEKEAELGKAYLANLKTEAKGFYTAAEGEGASDTILEMLDGATLEHTLALRDKFKAEANGKFPLTCNKCSSKDVSRATSLDTSEEDTGTGDDADKPDTSEAAVKLS